jgi:hypothetical protein
MMSSAELRTELEQLLEEHLRGRLDDQRWVSSGDLAALVALTGDEGTRDLLVTISDRRRRELRDLVFCLTDARGSSTSRRFTRNSQVRVASVGPQPWVLRVREYSEQQPVLQFERRLPAAAASSSRDLGYVAMSENGAVIVKLREDDESHLRADVAGRLGDAELARIRWSVVRPDAEAESRTILSPLAPVRDGAVAAYDLGSIADVTRVNVFPIDILDGAAVGPDDLADTCTIRWRGSARRAWQEWLRRCPCDSTVRVMLEHAMQ